MSLRHMLTGAAFLAGLAAAGAQAETRTTIIYDLPEGRYQLVPVDRADRAVAYTPGSASFDLSRGVWGAQSITPPAGLVLVEQGDFIDAKVYDGSGTSFGTIRRVLVDPATGLAHYAVVSTPEVGGAYITVPMSAIDASSMSIDMAARDIRLLPTHTMAELQELYPLTRISSPVVVGPVAMAPVSTTTVVTTTPGTTTVVTTPPYRMTQSGDWVGRAVVDPSGDLIGVVDYLLLDPATGAPRQAAVSGGAIGRGDYVLLPMADLRLSAGRLVAERSTTALLNAPRLPQAELVTRYGPVVVQR